MRSARLLMISMLFIPFALPPSTAVAMDGGALNQPAETGKKAKSNRAYERCIDDLDSLKKRLKSYHAQMDELRVQMTAVSAGGNQKKIEAVKRAIARVEGDAAEVREEIDAKKKECANLK